MIRKQLLLYLFLLAATFGENAAGQEMTYHFLENIRMGAEAPVVSCLLQDTQGLIWVGSNKGLFSYDGYSAQPHYTLGERSNSRIYAGVVADSAYLYLGADNGLLIYNYRTDSYEEAPVELPTDIRALVMHGKQLWLGTLDGLYIYHTDTQRLEDVSDGLPHRVIYSLIVSSDNRLYIGTYNGFCRYLPEANRFEAIALPISGGRNNLFVNSLLEDPGRGCIWIGTEGSLFRYRIADGETQAIEGFRGNSVKALAVDGEGRLLAGTDNGLYIYSEEAPLRHVVHDSRQPQSLSNNIIWTIFPDQEGNVWFGTDYGISLARPDRRLRYVSLSQITGSGDGNQLYAMRKDRLGDWWLGGTNGLIHLSRNAATWYKMGDDRHPLSHNRVRQLYEDKDGFLWVATDGSISRFDRASQQLIPYHIVDSTRRYNANWVYSLFEDDEGQLWVATCLGGIFVVDKQKLMRSAGSTYIAEKTYSIHNSLSGMFVNQMTTDQAHQVWAILYNSPNPLEKINPRTGEVSHFSIEEWRSGGSPNFLLCAEDGHLWIGYPGGVIRMDPADDSYRVLPFDAYSHNEVFSMAEADGRIWISTTDGLWVADERTLEVRRLNASNRRFTGLYFDPPTGEFYLGGVDEWAISTPAALLEEDYARPLLLTALYVNNRPLSAGGEGASPTSVRYARQIELRHDQGNLAVDLSDLPYSREEKSRLIYRLEGVDDDWNLLMADANRIIYNNLRYGAYRLVVSRLDPYGNPSPDTYSLRVIIRPPWYYTPWAKAAYVGLFLVLIGWTVNFFRVKNRLRLERIEKEKILEQSKAKMEFFTNLSHDLKAPLSLIIAPVSGLLLRVRNPQEKKQLEQVQRNALKLNSLIHQGLDFERVDSEKNTLLIFSQIELVSFARNLLSLYSEDKANEKRLTFDFRPSQERLYVRMDAIKLESILDNLLSNAVKYTPEGGCVRLRIDAPDEGNEVRIAVSDTGIGIPSQDLPYIFQRFFQSSQTEGKKEGTGIGLYLVKTYTELHGGSVGIVSPEGAGTTVTVSLPVIGGEDPASAISEESPALSDDLPRLLIVEDEPEVSEFIFQLLHARYHCRIAPHGKRALEMVEERCPDLILSDLMMPVMDGMEMVRQLKRNIPTSTIPIILLTGKDDKRTELESIRLHVDAFIPKPFEPDLLLSRVEQLLSTRQSQEAKARLEFLAAPKPVEAVSQDEKFLANVIQLIEEHIQDAELNVGALCEWTGTSHKQMYRKIKQLTGMTPVEYIKSIRMKKAAMLLKQHTFTVAEVMYMVGFSNHSYFSKCFQAEFGVTPKQYV